MKRCFAGRNALLTMLLLVCLPFGTTVAQDANLLHQVDPGVNFSTVERAYADMDARYAREGVLAQVRDIAIGQSQSELEALLGRPAVDYRDGSAEYHLSLPLTENDNLICQYRVFFDDDDKVEHAVWRRRQCAALVLEQLQ